MYLLGVHLSIITKSELLDLLLHFLSDGRKHHIVTTNPEFIVEAQENEEFRSVLNQAELSLIDGVGILCAIDYLQRATKIQSRSLAVLNFFLSFVRVGLWKRRVVVDTRVVERMTGVDLVILLCQQEWMQGRKMYLLGGTGSVATAAARRLAQINPHIQFRASPGYRTIRPVLEKGELDDKESVAIISDIITFNPDIVLVAYGHPWQDIWIDRIKNRIGFKIAVGVGGTFDYLAGTVPRAPVWMRRIGLEWLFRLITNPRRYKRISNATWRFVTKVVSPLQSGVY